MPDTVTQAVWLFHLAATLFMIGVIWFVQIVHYPLFAHVGHVESMAYQQQHARRTAWVVGPPMLIELATGILLLWVRPTGVSLTHAIMGVTLLAVVWLSTFFVQVPCHERLTMGFHPAIHRRLVATNWVRTVAWSLRGLLVMLMIGGRT